LCAIIEKNSVVRLQILELSDSNIADRNAYAQIYCKNFLSPYNGKYVTTLTPKIEPTS